MSEQRVPSDSDILNALASWQGHRTDDPLAACITMACIVIASQHHGHWGRNHMNRDAMITLMREVCDANGWKYTGGR